MTTPDMQEVVLGACLLALSVSLSEALTALAAFHDQKAGQWLDDLETQFIDGVKNSHTEGIPLENEKMIMDGAMVHIRNAVDGARLMIAEGKEGK